MLRLSRSLASLLALGLIVLVLIPAGACTKKTTGEPVPTKEELLAAEQQAEEEEAAAKAAAAAVVPPKVNEEIYIEMRARSVLILQKYQDDPATGEKEVEAMLVKADLTYSDLKEFENRIGPTNLALLDPKIHEKIQKLWNEYQK